jgi:hypothetical protein
MRAPTLVLDWGERELERRFRNRRGRAREARIAQVLLLLADGDSYSEIRAKVVRRAGALGDAPRNWVSTT